MAKGLYDGPLDKSMDFTNPVHDGRPASGLAVQNYIKEIDSNKLAVGYTEEGGARHLFFCDEADRDAYIEDPTKTYLIKDTIELEPMYYMNVSPISDLYNTVFLGDKGNFIEYTFETTNRGGHVVAEAVTATYTFSSAGTTRSVTQNYAPGTTVRFNVDNYIIEGTNNINIEIKGQLTKVSTSFSVVYQVVNLVLTDTMDISKVYRINDGDENVQIPYSVSGVGQKTMEWYIDGERVPVNPQEDIISDATSSRTKYINIIGLEQGRHSLQFRVGINVNGSVYYSGVRYREFIVSLGQTGSPIIVTATEFSNDAPVLGPSDTLTISLTQYETFPLRVAVFNPSGQYQNEVIASVGGDVLANIMCSTGEESRVSLTLTAAGTGILTLATGEYERNIDIDVEETELDIHEITAGLAMNFTAEGKSNESADRNVWVDKGGVYNAELFGFDWTNVSGWVNNRLIVPSGAHIDFNITPLIPNPTFDGKTIELEFKTINVEDENTVLIDLFNSTTGAGLRLTATEIQVVSADGNVQMSRRYKTDEDVRLSIVINKSSGSLLSRLAQVYFNGILSMTQEFTETDNFTCPKYLKVGGEGAGIILKQIRIYNTALDADAVVNNYILYRPTVEEMLDVYERNDLYESGLTTFDLDKIAGYLPVMILTGDMEPINTATDNKATTIMDVEYRNLQNPTYSFRMYHAQMRPQGTSSLTYPRKNLRLYTQKRDDTIVYDYEGKVIESKLYSFKPKAQPVNCWTLKADFAESSSTHNTGVARIWNEVMKQTQLNGDYVLRTQAQQSALDNGYQYDVRTTVDGFPIVIFWHRYESDPLTFLGKYNFNNDKSTESVFGFRDIPGFDNTHVNCWEFRDSGYSLALFKTPTTGRTYAQEFDYYASTVDEKGNWIFNQVWESRYPDYNKPDADVSQLRRIALWINSTEGASVLDDDPSSPTYGQLIVGDQTKFNKWQSEKAQYFDLPKLAAYYIYLMRFGAVDQTVKNSMFTTEDGNHWYFINYDNDTILGVRNDGVLMYGPEIDRQSRDPQLGGFAYAGHESVLWNNFETDPECMAMVRSIDSALFSAGLTYNEMIKMFNEEQAGKWAEKVYNKDAMYKYIEPWLYDDEKYLGSLQGSRSDHRKWWISNRFSNFDAIYANSAYQNSAIHFLIPNAPNTSTFTIEAGRDFYYGWGQNRTPVEIGVRVENEQYHTFILRGGMDEWQVGTPLYIYAPEYIKTLDVSNVMQYIGRQNFDISNAWSDTLGSKMKSLIMGVDNPATDDRRNLALEAISGLARITTLENLNIAGFQNIKSLNLETLVNLKTFRAQASGVTSVLFANGAPLNLIEFPLGLTALNLNALPALRTDGIVFEEDETDHKSMKNITNISIHGCPNITNSPDLIIDWLDNKTSEDERCSVTLDNVNWELISHEDLIKICEFKRNGGHLNLVGTASVETIGSAEFAEYLKNTFIDEFDVFNPASQFYISAPADIFISGPTQVYEGASVTYECTVVGGSTGGEVDFAITSGGVVGEIYITTEGNKGYLTTTENLSADHPINISVMYSAPGQAPIFKNVGVTILKRTYPTPDQVTLTGPSLISVNTPAEFNIGYTVEGITGDMTAEWTLTGDLANDATITYRDNEKCIVLLPTAPESGVTFGNVHLVLKKTVNSSTIATKDAGTGYQDEGIAISRATNPYLMDVMVANNLINPVRDNNDKMTKITAATITPAQLYTSSTQSQSTSIFAGNSTSAQAFKNNVTSFDEFQYFTRVGEIGIGLFRYCNKLQSVTLPPNVASIKDSAFSGCTGLTSITLSEGVTSIENQAFANCTGLTSVTLPSTVTLIDRYAFSGCTGLTHVTFNCNIPDYALYVMYSGSPFYGCNKINSVDIGEGCTSIGNQAFLNCNWLTSISLPEGVISIGNHAFSGCTELTSINLPEGLTSIGQYAFQGCTGLTSITIPENLTTISLNAFHGCTGLTGELVIPEGITSIEQNAFGNCTKLTSVILPSTLTTIGNYAFYNCTELTHVEVDCSVPIKFMHVSDSESPFYQCTNIESVVIGEGATTIGNYAFCGLTKLTSINIPEGITNIGYRSIYNCNGLTLITLPSTLITISNYAFQDCTGLTHVTFNCNVPNFALYVSSTSSPFYGCTNINSITIEEGVTTIGQYAFCGLTKLTGELELPSTVTTIGNSAFYNCAGLTGELVIPEGVISIGNQAFYGCAGLISVILPSTITSFGGSSFQGCTGLTSVIFNCNVPNYALNVSSSNSPFYQCTNINSVTIEEGVTTIGQYAFYRLTKLTGELELPSTVTTIGNYAFYNCTGLTSITLPEGLTSIGESTFAGCTGLTSITLPSSITKWGNSSYHSEFAGCTGLTHVTFNCNIPAYAFQSDSTSYTFSGCTNLDSVTIGEGVTIIDTGTFSGCAWFTGELELPSTLTTIGIQAFQGCSGLTAITIPEGVTSIGQNAFAGCTELISAALPKGLNNISGGGDSNIFLNCIKLASITIDSENTTYSDGEGNNCIIIISSHRLITGCKNTVIPEGVTSFGSQAFQNCVGLTSINIPSSVTDIYHMVFRGCSGLESITVSSSNSKYMDGNANCIIEKSGYKLILGCKNTDWTNISYVTTIEYSAFYGCTGLTSITLPPSINLIRGYAFYGCSGLTGNIDFQLCPLLSGIENEAFYDCSGLTGVLNFSEGFKEMGQHAFDNCSGITSISIPSTVTSIGGGYPVFQNCSSLTSITVASGNTSFNDGNGSNCIVQTSNGRLITGCKNTVIPSTATYIDGQAFYGCTGLTSITIPSTITTIGYNAFHGCTGLTSITLPSSVTSIASQAFQNCTGLTHVTFNCNVPNHALQVSNSSSPFYQCTNINSVTVTEGVTSIASDAFYGCTWLTSITLPSTITSVGSSVFYNCTNLSTITSLPTTPPSISSNTLPGIGVIQHIYVPSTSVSAYKGASNWNVYSAWISEIQ